jgi:hypothetical protein
MHLSPDYVPYLSLLASRTVRHSWYVGHPLPSQNEAHTIHSPLSIIIFEKTLYNKRSMSTFKRFVYDTNNMTF